MAARLKKLLVTGASGAMATGLRPLLSDWAQTVRLSSRGEMSDLQPHEEFAHADLADADQVEAAVKGCDAVLHLGGYSVEGPFNPILEGNIRGMYNLYEAARAHGQPRILFASSNHVVGYHSSSQTLDASALPKPDSLYGVSKCFGEALASFYHSKFGQQTAIVRIGSCLEKATDHRQLSTWISFRDFDQLCRKVFSVPVLGCPVIYGASANKRSFWDNSAVGYLGWQPSDDAEVFADAVDAANPTPDLSSGLLRYHGGAFTDFPIYKDDTHG